MPHFEDEGEAEREKEGRKQRWKDETKGVRLKFISREIGVHIL